MQYPTTDDWRSATVLGLSNRFGSGVQMIRFEYLAIVYGIIVGLALGNVASSVHMLLEAGKRVRWHWMAPLNAAGVTLATLGTFWAWWTGRTAADSPTIFLQLLPGSVASLLLYIICATTLPDAVPETGIDLREFYFSSRRRFWTLQVVYFTLRLFQVGLGIALSGFDPQVVGPVLPLLIGAGANILIAASLIYVRAPWWNGFCICLGFVGPLLVFGPMRV